jgi:hypothetical protein
MGQPQAVVFIAVIGKVVEYGQALFLGSAKAWPVAHE